MYLTVHLLTLLNQYIMSDDLKKKQPEDPSKININQVWEVNYWCNKFGVTETTLKQAVKAVGPMVKDVKKYLGK